MADREMSNDRRMSDVEALMWNLEKDPHLSSSVANVTVLDRAPDLERLRERLATAVAAIPRLRQRVVPALGRLAPPEWRDDPDFDLDWQVRRLNVPGQGTHRDLLDLATDLASRPFDRTRPLWEFTVVDGLEDGRAALIQKLHHTVADGEGSVRMSEQFIDLERDADVPITQAQPVASEVGPAGLLDTTIDTLTHNIRRQMGMARRNSGTVVETLTHPDQLLAMGADTVELVRSTLRQLAVTDSAHSPLWTERSLGRRFETLRVDLDRAKRAAKALGGSINDFFVTGAAGAAGAYHRNRGHDVDELRISMPVSTRAKGSSGGNAFTPTRVLVPVAIEDPEQRFAAIQERLSATRRERALTAANSLAGVVNLLPTSVVVRFARNQVETVDFATSNVRGAPIELFIAGARIEANYPMGPTGGTAWNLTTLSYNGSLDMGVNIDTAAIEKPEELRERLEEAYAELLAFA